MIFIDDTPVHDGAPYLVDFDGTDWGRPGTREPAITATAGGTWAVYPLATSFGERRGRLTLYAQALDAPDKWRVLSELQALLSGQRIIHRAGRQLAVYFLPAGEAESDAQKAGTIVGVTAEWVAADPFWKFNQPLAGIDGPPVNAGDAWALWDDNSHPAILPGYTFSTASFTLTNWGTAHTYAAGTITGGPASSTVYLKGPGSNRQPVALNGAGAGAFTADGELLLVRGDNAIRVENAAGSLITPGGSFVISFGDTYMRFF